MYIYEDRTSVVMYMYTYIYVHTYIIIYTYIYTNLAVLSGIVRMVAADVAIVPLL